MSKEIVRILSASDLHGLHHHTTDLLRPADIFAVVGDISNVGSDTELKSFFDWFSNLDQFQHKIFCLGNHELGPEKDIEAFKELVPKNVIFLHDSAVEIEGLKFYGSARTKAFYEWAFMYKTEEEAREIWSKVPLDTQVFLHHQPSYAIRDYVERLSIGEIDHNAGCKILGEKIDELDDLLLSLTGHLHSKKNFGASRIGNTMFANVAQLNDHYINKNRRPLLFEIDKNTKEIEEIK